MATNQQLMLEEITMDYHAFVKDQVLTDKQLNELINYFEDQDRLTRTCLIGVGIVCGLSVRYNSSDPSIAVRKGCGVTTDGDLLLMDTTAFKDFKVYINRKKGTNDPIYDPFFPVANAGKQIDLWELVVPNKDGVLPENAQSLTTFNASTGKVLDDMVCLLYLEYYLQDPDKCTAIDCDNQGPHQLANLKVLLLSKADMDKVINRDAVDEVIADSIYKKYNESIVQYFDLPLLKAKRIILNATNTSSIGALAKSYVGLVHAEAATVINAVQKLYEAYKFIIDPSTATNLLQLKQALQLTLASNPTVYHSQYLYDYYKDVITCFNELRECLFHCISECCPDKYAFPKHLMLGELKIGNTMPAPYRHDFYPSPAISGNQEKLLKCRSMWQRMQQAINLFFVPHQPSDVKITPSADYDRWLEDRAIPFYYKNAGDVVKNWNYSLSSRGAAKSTLSYHATAYAGGLDSTINPLDYNIDRNNFFRVEGHLGKQLTDAMTGINKIRNDKSIPFEIIALRLNKTGRLSDINIDDFDCQFDDLNAVLQAWLVEQNCLYANITRFFSGFSTNREIGFHARLDDYKATTAPVAVLNTEPSVLRPGFNYSYQPAAIGVQTISASATSKPICKTIYTVDTTISNNLEVAKDALGIYFADAIKKPAVSADDMIAGIKSRSANDPNLAKLNPEEREIVYDTPITLVAHTYEISYLKPITVNEINMDMLEKYIQRIQRLCAYVKKLRSRIENVFTSANYARQGYETYYLFLIQELIANCCAAEKLESLLEEIEKRKKKILDSLLFANYAKQHPGLEHKAGVHRGGTLVLVYAQDVRGLGGHLLTGATDAVIATSTASPALSLSSDRIESELKILDDSGRVSLSMYNDVYSFAYWLVTNQGSINFAAEVERYLTHNHIKQGTLAEQQFNRELAADIKEICARLGKEDEASVAANVVIADFCLPYLCCSDCPPINFIMPAQQYNLALPKAVACNDEELLEFRKEPLSGTVKASAGFEAAVSNTPDGRSFFDPTKVPVASFGTEISFTIDGQVTDCRIMVLKHPVAKFTFKVTEENDAAIAVQFTNTSDDATGKAYVYEWNFGDNRPSQKVDNKNDIPVTYKKAALEQLQLNGKIPITLIATNGPCSNTFPDNVPYAKEVPVSLNLPTEFICNDANPVGFTNVQPANGVIASPTEADAVDNANRSFNPAKVKTLGQVINFTVNNKPTSCKITVLPHPNPSFTTQVTSGTAGVPANVMIVTFTNTTPQQAGQTFTYSWAFSDGTGKITTDLASFPLSFNIDKLKSMGQNALTVTLEAKNIACAGKTEGIQIPFPAPPPLTCTDKVIAFIDSDIQVFNSPEMIDFLNKLKTSNPTLFPLVQTTVKEVDLLLRNAKKNAGNFNDPAVQFPTLQAVKGELEKLYASQFDKTINDTIITPAIAAMLKLALDVVRCVKEIDGSVKQQLIGIIERFISIAKELAKRFGKLNAGKAMVTFIDTWLNDTELQDAQVKQLVQRMIKAIADNFPA